MKKSKRNKLLLPIILLAVLAALIVTVIIVKNIQKKKEEIKVSGEIILTVNDTNAQTISWTSEENNFAFHRGSNGQWVYDKDEAFPVSQDEVRDVFVLFRALKAAFVIENVTDYAQYGLKDPLSTVIITTTEKAEDLVSKETQAYGESTEPGDLRTVKIDIGAFSVMDEQRYISIGDGNVYMVSRDPYETLNVPEMYMIANDKVPYFTNILTSEAKTPEGSWTIGYDRVNYKEYSYARDDYYYMEKDGKKLMLDPTVSLNYYTNIVNTVLENYVNYKVRDDELASYGLDQPEYTLDFNTFTTHSEDGTVSYDSFRLILSRDPAYVASLENEDPDAEPVEFKAFLRKDNSPIIYELNEEQFQKITAQSYNDLRYKAMMPADIGDIEGIDFTVDGQTYSITSELSEDGTIRTHFYNGNPLNVNNLKNALTSLTAAEFTDDAPEGPSELTMVFHLSNPNFPTVTLNCYRKDGNYSLITVDGEPASLVLRTRMNSLREVLIKIALGNDVKETEASTEN